MEFTKQEKSALEWLLVKGMEITNSNKKYEVFDNMHQRLVNNLPIFDVVKSLPNDDEVEQAANEEASRIFDGTGSGSEWYARHHGFTDGVEWLKNHLAK